MNTYKRIYLIPITLFSTVAVIHNTFLAKETANLHTGYLWLDWLLATIFALGIESALWTLIIHQKIKAVKAYTILLFLLSLLYYGRGGKLNQIVSLIHPEAWLYLEGVLMALIFSVLLSGFLWYLTEVAIEHMRQLAAVESTQHLTLAASTVMSPVAATPIPTSTTPVVEVVVPVATTPVMNETSQAEELVVKKPDPIKKEAEQQTHNPNTELDKEVIGPLSENKELKVVVETIRETPLEEENDKQEEYEQVVIQLNQDGKRTCLHCESELVNKSPRARFCSDTCKSRYHRQEKASA